MKPGDGRRESLVQGPERAHATRSRAALFPRGVDDRARPAELRHAIRDVLLSNPGRRHGQRQVRALHRAWRNPDRDGR